MAFDKIPTTWLANWAEDGTDITLPLASLTELTAAEADAATGDIREIMYAILTQIFSVYDALIVADRPTQMVITRSSVVNGDQTITYDYNFKFVVGLVAGNVIDEPA